MVIFERDTEFEEKNGISFENLSFNRESNNSKNDEFYIYGEYCIKNCEEYEKMELEAIFYDDEKNILKIENSSHDLRGFLGRGSFTFWGYLSINTLNKTHKIKIIPSRLVKKILNRSFHNNNINIKTENISIDIHLLKNYSQVNKHDRKKEIVEEIDAMISQIIKDNRFDLMLRNYD